MDDVQLHEKTFEALAQLRNSKNIEFSNVLREIDRGVGFMPWWPIYGVGPSGRVEFVRTEEVYATLELLSERKAGWAFDENERVPGQLQIVDLTWEFESLAGVAPFNGIFHAHGVDALENMLRKLSPIDIEGTLKMMEMNESEYVMVPVIALGPDKIFKLQADCFLDMLMDIHFAQGRVEVRPCHKSAHAQH